MRLIDVDDAIEKINGLCVDGNENWIGTENQSFVDHSEVIDILCDAPTVDVVPVVHGQWERYYYDSGEQIGDEWYCSECSMCNDRRRTWYCPNCGAKMDGGNEE